MKIVDELENVDSGRMEDAKRDASARGLKYSLSGISKEPPNPHDEAVRGSFFTLKVYRSSVEDRPKANMKLMVPVKS